MVIVSSAQFALHFLSSKMLVSADKLNNLCITETVTNRFVIKRINVSLLSTNIKLL